MKQSKLKRAFEYTVGFCRFLHSLRCLDSLGLMVENMRQHLDCCSFPVGVSNAKQILNTSVYRLCQISELYVEQMYL